MVDSNFSIPLNKTLILHIDELNREQDGNWDIVGGTKWQLMATLDGETVVLAEKFPSALDYLMLDQADPTILSSFKNLLTLSHGRRSTRDYASGVSNFKSGFAIIGSLPDHIDGIFSVKLRLAVSSSDSGYTTPPIMAEFLASKYLVDCDPHFSFSPAPLYESVRHESLLWHNCADRPEGLADATQSFNHQLRSLSWMCSRESGQTGAHTHIDTIKEEYSLQWVHLTDNVFYSPHFHMISFDLLKTVNIDFTEPRGGILADEMGMGKTVEVLSLILSRPHPNPAEILRLTPNSTSKPKGSPAVISGPVKNLRCYCSAKDRANSATIKESSFVQCRFCSFYQHTVCVAYDSHHPDPLYACPTCGSHAKTQEELSSEDLAGHGSKLRVPVELGTTLIVCPETILLQWESEIRRHVQPGKLRYAVFKGETPNFSKADVPHPSLICRAEQFRDFDIIITTYDVLSEALRRNESSEAQKKIHRRNESNLKYVAMPSPLVGAIWYRVCFDESQLLGDGLSRAAQLSLQLRVRYRWAISGTPISRSVSDLFGLMVFLDVQPYCDRVFWKKRIEEPLSQGQKNALNILRLLLKRVMWRTEKEDAEEVNSNMPGLTEAVHEVRFSEVEKYMYQRRWKFFENKLIAAKQRQRMGKLKEEQMTKIVADLVALRLACCHPQLGQKTGLKDVNEGIMSAPAVFKQLIHQARLQAEERQATRVFYLHGLAALAMAEKDWKTAADLYRSVLDPGEFDLHTGSNPLYHARYNLIEALKHLQEISNDEEEVTTLQNEIDQLQAINEVHANNYIADAKAKFAAEAYIYAKTVDSLSVEYLAGEDGSDISGWISLNEAEKASSIAPSIISTPDLKIVTASAHPPKPKPAAGGRPKKSASSSSAASKSGRSSVNSISTATTATNIYDSDEEDLEHGGHHFSDSSTPSLPWAQYAQLYHEEEHFEILYGVKTFSPRLPPAHLRLDPEFWFLRLDGWWRVILMQLKDSEAIPLLQRLRSDMPKNSIPDAALANKMRLVQWLLKPMKEFHDCMVDISNTVTELCGHRTIGNFENMPPPPLRRLVDRVNCPVCVSRRTAHEAKKKAKYALKPGDAEKLCIWCFGKQKLQDLKRLLTERPHNAFVSALGIILSYTQKLESDFQSLLKKSYPLEPPQSAPTILHLRDNGISTPTLASNGTDHLETSYMDEDNANKKRRRTVSDLGGISEGSPTKLSKLSETEADVPHAGLELLTTIQPKLEQIDASVVRQEAIESAKANFKSLDIYKRLIAEVDDLLDANLEYTNCGEELKMVATRMQLRGGQNGAEVSDVLFEQTLFDRAEIPVLRADYDAHLRAAQFELQEQTSQLRYLTTQAENVCQTNCPICWDDLPPVVLLLSCGHSGCPECLKKAFETAARCPMCRTAVNRENAKLVNRDAEDVVPEVPTKTENQRASPWGSKIDAIVALVRQEMEKCPGEKILLFSHWTQVLKLITAALREAQISVLNTQEKDSFAATLDQFRSDSSITVLCLPLSRGSKGANLMCASHIIFAEPSLLTASEAQAIGRIHRLGQTKKMKIHRFFVAGSIEESIFELSRLRQKHFKRKASVGFGAQDREVNILNLDTLERLLRGKSLEGTISEDEEEDHGEAINVEDGSEEAEATMD